MQVLEDHTNDVYAVCFSPSSWLLEANDASIKVYSFNEGNAILAHTLEGHTDHVLSLSFSPECKLLCSPSNNKSIKF